MNSNTFKSFSAAYPSGHAFALPAAITTTTSSETAFLLSNGLQAVITVPKGNEILGSQTPFDPNANTAKTSGSGRSAMWMGETAPYFNASSFNNRPFRLRAFGYISGGGTTLTSTSASVTFYGAVTNTATVTSGTAMATFAFTGGVGAANANWMIDCSLLWDSVTGIIGGTKSFSANGTGIAITSAGAALTTAAATNVTSLAFGLTWVFATTSTSNTIGLTELSLEQM